MINTGKKKHQHVRVVNGKTYAGYRKSKTYQGEKITITATDAKDWQRKFEERKAEIDSLFPLVADSRKLTVQKLGQEYKTATSPSMKDRSCPSEKTIEERESVFRLRVDPILGNQKIHQLRDPHIFDFYKRVCAQAEALNNSTVLFHTYKVFNAFLNWAVKRQYLITNPTSPNTLENVQAWIAEAKRESKSFELTEQDVTNLLEAVSGKPYGITFHVMARSGLRLGEALAVKWEDIDIYAGCINVSRQVQEVSKKVLAGTKKESDASQIVIAPKTKAGIRQSPIQGDTIKLLLQTPVENRTGYLFQTSASTPMYSSAFRQRIFKPVTKAMGLSNVTPHDLRHYCGTDLVASAIKFGTDLEEGKQMMGHSQLSTTLDIYAEARPDHKKRFRMALSNLHAG